MNRTLAFGAVGTTLAVIAAPAFAAASTTMVTVTPVPGGYRVCGTGRAAEPPFNGQWQFLIAGARDDGSAILAAAGEPGSSFAACYVIHRGSGHGRFVATLVYAGVGATPLAVQSVSW